MLPSMTGMDLGSTGAAWPRVARRMAQKVSGSRFDVRILS